MFGRKKTPRLPISAATDAIRARKNFLSDDRYLRGQRIEQLAYLDVRTGTTHWAVIGPRWKKGLLSREDATQLDTDRPVYVVYSDHTPIAWERRDGVVRTPAARYGSRTNRHQAIARLGLAWAEPRVPTTEAVLVSQ